MPQPTCHVDKQDNDPVEQVNNINKLKQGVLDGSIPSAVADSGATLSVRTIRDRKRNQEEKCVRCDRMPVGQGLPHAQR
jgi:hypothetical protein